ncbi:hypothetical protein A3D80_02850 [Candidatus Roizmanbacteria bacterium RIFCSPHIGHO2_02_FULL_40_13b]|nr:MAG: hypothetical protein A3D80_02850 [Candidatus Roizmanbacteria bacterium RIFCSPHIGHO2_02_FULL_40_13b]OGK49289.1 MAG: hypothetical protein A3A56_00680 [Candidatus Roizmanbacteria bacterium RIFCSPLOWO2_01_FULL_40_32]
MEYFGEHIKERVLSFWTSYRSEVLLLSISFILMILSGGFFFIQSKSIHAEKVTSKVVHHRVQDTVVNFIYVDISGAVKNPNVYKLPEGSRMNDLILKAGGFTKDVDSQELSQTVNKAHILSDQEKIYIPRLGDSQYMTKSPSNLLYTDQSERKININSASEEEIDTIVGIGPAISKKIIAGRTYKDIADLVAKKIVGQALFIKIKDSISVY